MFIIATNKNACNMIISRNDNIANHTTIILTRFSSGNFVGEWRKDALLSPPDAMTIYCTKKKNFPRKNDEFAFNRRFLGRTQ